MKHFTVMVGRAVHDYESVVLSVAAGNKAAAERKALKLADEDDEFWWSAKSYVGESDRPEIQECVEEKMLK